MTTTAPRRCVWSSQEELGDRSAIGAAEVEEGHRRGRMIPAMLSRRAFLHASLSFAAAAALSACGAASTAPAGSATGSAASAAASGKAGRPKLLVASTTAAGSQTPLW